MNAAATPIQNMATKMATSSDRLDEEDVIPRAPRRGAHRSLTGAKKDIDSH